MDEQDAAVLSDLYARVQARAERVDDAVEHMGGLERAHTRQEIAAVLVRMTSGISKPFFDAHLFDYFLNLALLATPAKSYGETWVAYRSSIMLYQLLASHFLPIFARWFPSIGGLRAYAIAHVLKCNFRPARPGVDEPFFDEDGHLALSMRLWAERMRQETQPVRRRALLLPVDCQSPKDTFGHQLLLVLETDETLYIVDSARGGRYPYPVHDAIEREFRRAWPSLRQCHAILNRLPIDHLALGSCMSQCLRALLALAMLHRPYDYLMQPLPAMERLLSRLLFMELTRVRFWLMRSERIWGEAWIPLYVPHDDSLWCYALTTDWIWLVRLPEVRALGGFKPSENGQLLFIDRLRQMAPMPWCQRFSFVDDSAYDRDGIRPAFHEEDAGVPWVPAPYLSNEDDMLIEHSKARHETCFVQACVVPPVYLGSLQ